MKKYTQKLDFSTVTYDGSEQFPELYPDETYGDNISVEIKVYKNNNKISAPVALLSIDKDTNILVDIESLRNIVIEADTFQAMLLK